MQLGERFTRLAGNLLLDSQYDPQMSDEDLTRQAAAWGRDQVRRVPAHPLKPRNRDAERVLKIGYVSADLYRHPVGWLGGGPIMGHDRGHVHVTLYANQTCADPLTESLRQSADVWTPVMGMDDPTLADRIAADGIDILVDLSGHTSGNRLGAFARRPAPVQASWLGYFATTGLPTIDYVLLDDCHVADGCEAHFVEEVVRLPGCRFCYTPDPDMLGISADANLSDRPITFGSFNNAAKLNDPVIALWAEVLKATPESQLLLKWRSFADPGLQARIRETFAGHGIARDRITFEGLTDHPHMLNRYRDIDVALDPFPFTGGLTTCEALFMGVPVVTLPGRRCVSRQSHSILTAVGHPEWSAATPGEYVAAASRLAGQARQDPSRRSALRESVLASPLCDPRAFAEKLEQFYRRAWRRYLEQTG